MTQYFAETWKQFKKKKIVDGGIPK